MKKVTLKKSLIAGKPNQIKTAQSLGLRKIGDSIVHEDNAVLAGRVFQSLESLGISQMNIERVDHSDIEAIQQAVKEKAVKNGKAKAVRFSTLDAICEALQCQPGDILEYDPNAVREAE